MITIIEIMIIMIITTIIMIIMRIIKITVIKWMPLASLRMFVTATIIEQNEQMIAIEESPTMKKTTIFEQNEQITVIEQDSTIIRRSTLIREWEL